MKVDGTTLAWYAVHLRSNQEKQTAAFLADRGVPHLLPSYTVQSNRRDRKVTLVKPLFTGYVFVRIKTQSNERMQVLQAPGTVRIVGFGNRSTPIPDETIESIRILVGNDGSSVRPHPLVREGRIVRVVDGAFAGAVGVLHRTEEKKPKLVVEIDFLGRAVAVPIDIEQVQPVLD